MPDETKPACLKFMPVKCNRTWMDFFRGKRYTGYDIYAADPQQDNGLPVGSLYQNFTEEYYFSSRGRGLGRFALMEIADKLKELNEKD
jgi:hypothetical protein